MRCLALCLVAAFPMFGHALQTTPNDGNPANVFVLTIDDAMIDALKQGMSLESQVPEEARGKFKTIRIQYKPTPTAAPPAGSILRNNETTQNPPTNPLNPATQGTSTASQTNLGNSNPNAWGNLPSGSSAGATGAQAPFNLGLPPNTNPTPPQSNSQTNLTSPPLRLDSWNAPAGSNPLAGNATSNPITLPEKWANNSWFNPSNRDTAASGQLGNVPANANAQTTLPNPPSAVFGGFPQRTELPNLPGNTLGNSNVGLPPQSAPTGNYRNELVTASATELAKSIEEYWSRGNVELPPPPSPAGGLAGVPATDADRSPSDSVGRLPIPTSEVEKTLLAKVSTLEATNKTLETQRKESTKWLLFMFLFLMCSLGANLYLGWIARGFYTRFHEMANELRDTFTSTGV